MVPTLIYCSYGTDLLPSHDEALAAPLVFRSWYIELECIRAARNVHRPFRVNQGPPLRLSNLPHPGSPSG
jgi:hypothetical protein